ncbi:MAG: pyridoxal-dependent decarboxylase [Gemmatimonadetes bacterium]|nr:pyridoxal-dependent decarboxylase [Gemmatimonadota bacterium]
MTDPEERSVAGDAGAAAAEELRLHGHALVDRMADYLACVHERPVSTNLSPARLATRFAGPLPREGRPAEDVWESVWKDVVGEAIHLAHPMYMGHQVAPPLPQAVLADALASLLNNSIAVWEMSPTGTLVEAQVIRWMTGLIGFPEGSDGTIVSGGSAANLTGLLAAREAVFPGVWARGVAADSEAADAVVFTSSHAHYSLERALGVMGLPESAAIAVEGEGGRLDPESLSRQIAASRAEGKRPLAIVATAASTATGHFDDLDAISRVAQRERVWLHVDAAHGGSFMASPGLRSRLRGIERADSVAWDPHKMMFMPISAGAILIRDHRHLDAAFQQSAPYLFHLTPGESRSSDIGRRTLQCSKRFDALKIWVSLQHYGLDHFGRLLEKTVENTIVLHRIISAAADFEAMHEPEANILCFRHLPGWIAGGSAEEIDRLQDAVRARYNMSGKGWITATSLGGQRVLRVTMMNPHTESVHLEALLAGLREEAAVIYSDRSASGV